MCAAQEYNLLFPQTASHIQAYPRQSNTDGKAAWLHRAGQRACVYKYKNSGINRSLEESLSLGV
ncbi:hypothetical protein F240042I4_56690 [Eisenbergiella tayi]